MAQASFRVHMVHRGLYLWLWCRYHVVTTFIIPLRRTLSSLLAGEEGETRKARKRWRRRERMRLDAVFQFSGYKVYFRCAGRRPVPGCAAIGDVFGCRCNLAYRIGVPHARYLVPGKKIQCRP
ncbi:hypothetical protein P5V15_003140 [Pogonomyrmex californicus]